MSLKRKLTQDDLRKAMNEHKKKLGTVKKIESPLAKYTDSGQLMCILCKSTVRNETVWPVHLNSKIHKENIALAKKTKLETENPVKTANVTSFKRPLSPSQNVSINKKIKGILKNNSQPVTQTKSSLPADFFDNNTKQVNGGPSSATQKSESKDSTTNITDVQSVEVEEEKEKEKEKEKVKDTNTSALPEGFFDDPVLDAKVRNVEYKDPIEEEWEKFQKEIKEETAQSAQIIADDQEEATTERQLDEIEEQIRHWSRVMDLVKRKEQVQATDRKQENIDDNVSSGDETEFDEFLDWRAKNSYK
ncbi:PREDICTED: zinc finger protein 830 [Dinoponera quadriceps]|uniref:Zinc finger protein 830 n=1 Tax=Dinoponera quadriceps TaxID=609295 RepID=A0A6P3WTI5_DINQU|nr:PREDICTED: zinc finger protein 830 [Dinoponera quadriceps]XP_014469142.1 PREDICTED: zinc finger protein 830 [Dinoponera quadriceps]